MPQTITIESAALPVERPSGAAELCDLVKRTRAAKHGLYPVGGRTTLDVGLPPSKPGVACDTTTLAKVIDYPARDMTITAQAGVTVAALQAELAKEGQWLPIDVASPEKATLGGAVAVNASGPRRYGYGTLRDYVIGISFVTDDGVEVKAGGRVVKNVAGYDLMKLQIGALGTLGVVTQLTLKVKPKPEAAAAVSLTCDSPALAGVLDALAASRTRPVACELTRADNGWTVTVGFEEKAAAVKWQVSALLDELKPLAVRDVCESPNVSFITANTALQLRPESRCIGKASVLPSQLASYVCDQALAFPDSLIHAHALSGVIWVHNQEPHYDPTTKSPEQRAALERLVKVNANSVVRRTPTSTNDTFAQTMFTPETRGLMRHVKRTLDPDNVFNPGRLFAD